MKSLKESLFDDNIKKDLTIRDVCELNPTKTGRGIGWVEFADIPNSEEISDW